MSPFDVRADPVLTPPKTGSNPSREWGVKSLEIWCRLQGSNPAFGTLRYRSFPFAYQIDGEQNWRIQCSQPFIDNRHQSDHGVGTIEGLI